MSDPFEELTEFEREELGGDYGMNPWTIARSMAELLCAERRSHTETKKENETLREELAIKDAVIKNWFMFQDGVWL